MIAKLNLYLNAMHKNMEHYNASNIEVSGGNVAWHIEHSYLTTIKIINAVLHSDATQFTPKFNLNRTIVFLTNKIPRGKAKAPKEVQAKGVSITELEQLFVKTIEKIEALNRTEKNQFFPHPFFGNLNKKQTIKCLTIHTKHHLKIINDILA